MTNQKRKSPVEKAQRILEGRCAECGLQLPQHSISCQSQPVSFFSNLKIGLVKRYLITTLKKIKENKQDV